MSLRNWKIKFLKNWMSWVELIIIPKKIGMVCFISDFRYLNKCLVTKPYSIPKIADILQKIEGLE